MIYFIQGERTRLIKIGYTTNVKKRIKGLITQNSEKLIFLKAVSGDLKTEQLIHQKFKSFNCHNEWFYPMFTLVNFIKLINTKEDMEELLK